MDLDATRTFLKQEIEKARRAGFAKLVNCVGTSDSRWVHAAGGDFIFDLAVDWNDESRKALCVLASAVSPDPEAFEVLEESLLLEAPARE